MKEEKQKYSIHSNTEHAHANDLEEARDICFSMVQHFGSGYIVDNTTDKVIEIY